MDHDEKVKRYLARTDALGIKRIQAAPPLHRVAWRAGIPLAPPLCMSFGGLALLFGSFFALSMYFVLRAPFWDHTPESRMATAVGALVGGVIYGLLMAAVFVGLRQRHGLPLWNDFE